MKRILVSPLRFTFCVLAIIALSACKSAPVRDDGLAAGAGNDAGAEAIGVDVSQVDVEPVDPDSVAGRAPVERIIYFDFDTSEIRAEYLDIIAQHGRYLAHR